MAWNIGADRSESIRRNTPGVMGARKPRTYLSGNYVRDMRELRILGMIRNAQTRRDESRDETPQFITYLTLALQNLSDIVGDDLSGKKKADAVTKALDASDKLNEVASFLWMFRADEPQRDFCKTEHLKKDYADWAKAITLKLWEIRNMFVHTRDSKVLVVTPDFYRFVEGELYGEAREHALGPGRKSEKVYKLKLFTPHNDAKTQYEFTRRGIIFLICLALYRHDASEFIQQFKDMQLPPRAWELNEAEDGGYSFKDAPECHLSEQALVDLRKKGGSVKAIIDAFTFYSIRSSRTSIDVMDADYLNFANILLYLNKVPLASYNYLALEDEAKALATKAADSTESAENRRFKYLLHPRQKDRFLTLALAFIEDFGKLPFLKFKRLDITPRADRKRYMFGKIPEGTKNEFGDEISDANGMDRHYAIENGVAQFEFVPEQHYGAVKISRLRGGVGENELTRLLLVMFDPKIRRGDPAKALKDYLTAYHRILERMLNVREAGELSLEDPTFRQDFLTVSGKDETALKPEGFVEAMKPFFPANITRFFVGADLKPTTEQLQVALSSRFMAMEDHARDFLVKLDRLTEWKQLDEAARKSRFPKCAVGELRFPPRTFKMNDSDLVRMVLRCINLFLQKDEKYRQLPRGMRHRGAVDFEFQLLHTDIGRFPLDPQGLWRTLEKRESLNAQGGALETLRNMEGKLFREEQARCRGRRDRNGKPLRVGHTLTMLAAAAAELYADSCAELRTAWCGELSAEEAELLPFVCPNYGVRAGLELDQKALVKTILGIDLDAWRHAYDYAHARPFENRRLEEAKDLISAQIPVPNAIAIRCVTQPADGTQFLFGPAFRAYQPYENGKMALRNYYDVAPLIAYVKTHKKGDAAVDVKAPGIETRGGQDPVDGLYGKQPPRRCEFIKVEVDKAIQTIQKAERQDKILLACAREYWKRYMADTVKSAEKKVHLQKFNLGEAASIADFFTNPIEETIGDVVVSMAPNDFARPAYGVIREHLTEIIRMPGLTPMAGRTNVYSFYDLWLALRDLQREENTVRLDFLPAIVRFNAKVGEPHFDCPGEEMPQKLFEYCAGLFNGKLTREECDAIIALDKRLRHPTRKGSKKGDDWGVGLLSINRDLAKSALNRLGFRVCEG